MQQSKKVADFVVTFDADGQHDPEQIPEILHPLYEDQADIVIGSRFLNKKIKNNIPRYRAFGIRTITRFVHNESWNLSDAQSGFRAYSKEVLTKLNLFDTGMSVSTEIFFRAMENNFVVKEIPVTINYEVESSSTHNFLTHGLRVLVSVIQYISLHNPLAFFGLPGIALLIISAIFVNNVFITFNEKQFISTNMILISLGSV